MIGLQINRFSVSNLHGRPRKNNHPFGIYENIKLGLINYTLMGLIEHHGVFINSGHYVSYIRQNNKWYHCDDKYITETNLLTMSNNVYLVFYVKEINIDTQVSECLAIKNILRMQGGHNPFSYVAISFSPKHYLMCSRFCLVWTLLLCIWKTDEFAWMFVCATLNPVTCVFYLNNTFIE